MSITASIKSKLKRALQSCPALWRALHTAKFQVKRVLLLKSFLQDVRKTYLYMYWNSKDSNSHKLSAELLFQYHKLEKGLVMPGEHRLFGLEPALAVMQLVGDWRRHGFNLSDPVFLGAVETLHAYADRLNQYDLDPTGKILPAVKSFLNDYPQRFPAYETPYALPVVDAYLSFKDIAHARRSVREYSTQEVPGNMIANAIELAQLSPSACNRQPCKVYIVSDNALKTNALALQNGNRGFGHQIPVLAAIVSESRGFFDASERHQPYVDGGLFAMSFAYALTAQGLSSCFLNWCASHENDTKLHQLLAIPDSEYVITLMAIGYAKDNVAVPRSARRDIASVLINR